MRGSPLLESWNRIIDAAPRSLLVAPTGQCTYSQVFARAQAVAEVLRSGRKNLDDGRVAILVEPGADFVAALFGTFQAGGCAVILSPLHAPAESRYFCEDSQAQWVIVSRAWADRIEALGSGPRPLIIEDVPEEPRSWIELDIPLADAPALQLYTSGTTGKPKGAVLTHTNLSVQQNLLREAWGLQSSDVLPHLLPLHHMHGLCISLLSTLGAGAGVRFIRKFDAAETWEHMGASTVFMAVPTIYSKLLSAFDEADPRRQARWRAHATRLRLATSGSAALPVRIAMRWAEIAGQIPLERFGMTEVGVALSNPLKGERKPGSVGLPLPTTQTKIVDEQGHESQTGELWITGPSVFSGYHRRPDATDAAFVEQNGVRWFRTGDTVTRDDAGYFRILGRTSVDILKSGGYKLSALEIEEVLREHPWVSEVAVVGLPDDVWGDRVVACIVPRPEHSAASLELEQRLREFAQAHLATYKVPKQIFVMTELPRNALGKVLKPELVRKFLGISNEKPEGLNSDN